MNIDVRFQYQYSVNGQDMILTVWGLFSDELLPDVKGLLNHCIGNKTFKQKRFSTCLKVL